MKDYALPSQAGLQAMIQACHVPTHIIRHSEAAAKLGVFLARRLIERGIEVDVDLVEQACLLHDLFRVCDFPLKDFRWFKQSVSEEDKLRWRQLKAEHGANRHEDAAYLFLKDRYPVLAETIRKHRYTALVDEGDAPWSWEEKLVYYADKRAMHDTIVPLKERLEEAHQRSALVLAQAGIPRDTEMETKVDAQICKLEAEVFSAIDLDPDEVTDAYIDKHATDSAA